MVSDSDSDGSHISSTPPKNPNPSFANPPKPKPEAKAKAKSEAKPKPKPQAKPKPESKSKHSDPPLPVPDLSTLDGHVPFRPDPLCSTSKSSFLSKPRRLIAFETPETEKSPKIENPNPKAKASHLNVITPNPKKAPKSKSLPIASETPEPEKSPKIENPKPKAKTSHLNVIITNLPSAPPKQLLKNPNEGNFVRLNINGYGRKYGFRNGKQSSYGKRKSSYSYSGNKRFRRKFSKKVENGNGIEEEEDLGLDLDEEEVSGFEAVEEMVAEVRKEASEENLRGLLKLVYGYDSFREGQLEAIKNIVAGESTMVVLPTGAGKSLCYQLPALILPGVTLVVSPLVALMVDQYRQLPPVIRGAVLSSNQTNEESSETLDRLQEGRIKVLFVSPERFLNASFVSICGGSLSISLIVVDEAHCISEWSHNFRPSYMRLRASILRLKFDVHCFAAMTATATTQTLSDIVRALEIPPTNVIQSSQIRENLQLSVTFSQNRLKDLLMLMKSTPVVDMRSIIIYCKFQAETDMICKHLCDNKIPAKAYHGGIPAKNRSRIQELFCLNKIRVIVATVAFGMGLDKRDVEAVIHYSLPESLEEYVQETGRAGRDGRQAYCHLFLDNPIYYKLRSLLYSDGVDEYTISKLLSDVFSSDQQSNGKVCSMIKESALRKFDMKEEVILTILTQLEMGDVQYLRLLPQLNVTCSVYFHKTAPALLSDKDIIVATILKKSETKHGHHVFDIPTIVNDVGMTAIDVLKWLQDLKHAGEITFELKDPAFCFVVVKKPTDFCSLTTHLTKWLSEVEVCKVRKLDEMFGVANFAAKECKRGDGCTGSLHTACIQRKILDYFSRDSGSHFENSSVNTKGSPFMRADIKVFLQSNSHAKFTPRAVARIMHGIPSPAFPAAIWSKGHFWGRYTEIDFPVVLEAATIELREFVKKTGVCM